MIKSNDHLWTYVKLSDLKHKDSLGLRQIAHKCVESGYVEIVGE